MIRKTFLSVFVAVISSTYSAQVGINTSNPQATLHVDGAKDNPASGLPSATQELNDFSVTSSGNVGVGTITPSEKLDVANGNIRVRDINTNIGGSSDKLVVTDKNGVLKTAGGSPFSTGNSGNRVLNANGGGVWVYTKDWQNNQDVTLPIDEVYDPFNAYDPATGIFTVPQDGLYYILSIVELEITSPGTLDGNGGMFTTKIFIDSGVELAGNSVRVSRGNYIQGGINRYKNYCNGFVWLKAGQTVKTGIYTYGTYNMAANDISVTIPRSLAILRINKIF